MKPTTIFQDPLPQRREEIYESNFYTRYFETWCDLLNSGIPRSVR
ncbi:hypothetical protein NC653_018119 [Populus alba x Populus x berolinensis]|uniref:Uncharacterized protein n=1 Tax=Populus alba x Populus x berolinensis TaxID=444605 RepID=A0AAD6QRU8_9ROSI|nr:hypothetical protein NC653_018119 [Populus alba x Populus x berolinensis]